MRKVRNESGEYKFYELELGLPEGFTFEFEGGLARILGWRDEGGEWHKNSLISDADTYPIRVVVSIIGFTDLRAPTRNWGVE